jgi:hypothetical protein
MKKDARIKEISKAVPGGTMPLIGAKPQLQAAPGTSPVQAPPITMPIKTDPKTTPEKAVPKISPDKAAAEALPGKTTSKIPPAKTVPDAFAATAVPGAQSVQTMPKAAPLHTAPDKMIMQAAANAVPAGTIQENMPVQPGPAGIMPSMINQIPIMCCPYLMNMQCPMLYGANLMGMDMVNSAMHFGTGPVTSDMMPYTGGGSMAMIPGSPVYPPYGMGVMPSMNNQYLPMGGTDY